MKPTNQQVARRWATVLWLIVVAPTAFAGSETAVSFRNDIMPLLSKAGCNAGTCHGNANGKAGFKLSLRGQDPEIDWGTLTREYGGRRINVLEPASSLILLKATTTLPHEGGQRFRVDSEAYTQLHEWIASGARDDGDAAPKLVALEVTPTEQVLVEPVREIRLQARARFSNGTERDVSRVAVYEPSTLHVTVSSEGLVTSQRPGETTVLVRFLEQQVPVGLAFIPARPEFKWDNPPEHNFIDREVFAKLRRLRINPSSLCTDEVFLRRAYLDLLGLIPTAEEARAFHQDTACDKRARLVETLLTRPEFTDYWTLKWADLLRLEERQLDKRGMKTFYAWIRASIATHKPLDQFARELVSGRGSTYTNAPANWYRANRTPVERGENTAQLFLGARLKCAQCHNHPYDRWTQDDYHNWTALFRRVEYQILENKRTDENDKHEFVGDQIVYLTNKATWINPRLGKPATPRLLGGALVADLQLPDDGDELNALADWLTSPANPWFSRMQANRIWYHLMGRGLVDPVDDFRASNPASHPALLDALAYELSTHGFDLRHLIRVIMSSRVYQLDSEPNATNLDDQLNYSHPLLRRLTAEQLLDSQSLALDAPLQLKGQPDGTRIAQLIEGRKFYKPLRTAEDRFLAAFGKPPRLVCSESERSNATSMNQVFQLLSGPILHDLLQRPANIVQRLVLHAPGSTAIVEELFWTALSRAPDAGECEALSSFIAAAPEPCGALEDVAWALLNSKEFIFRR